jgi:hypothetical protein
MKFPAIKTLLHLQLLYLVLAIGFNAISLWRVEKGLSGLTSTSPMAGIVTMLVILLVVIIGYLGFLKVYCVFNTLLFSLVAVNGVYGHLLQYSNVDWHLLYLNRAVWNAAIMINVFGVIIALTSSLSIAIATVTGAAGNQES